MSFPEAIRTCLSKYADFNGRARRSEYWNFWLFLMLVEFLPSIVGSAAKITALSLLAGIAGLAFLIPHLAVAVRRLHDTGRSGWWLFIALIPLVGGIVLLVFMVGDSNTAGDRFGPSPKMLAHHA